jgi:ABC-type transport system involved in cytochrome c biogenesis permease subunit
LSFETLTSVGRRLNWCGRQYHVMRYGEYYVALRSQRRIIGLIMLIIAIVFIMFALNHPEKSFPWSNTITWLLYGVYFLVTVVLLIAPKMKIWRKVFQYMKE